MARPALLTILPRRLREAAYFRRYHHRYSEWPDLFSKASLAVCPDVAMYDLVPGDVISGCIAFNGFYEWDLTKLIARHATKGGLLVDVGANMGYFSLLWAGLNHSSTALAFEASPRNVSLLRNNIEQNALADRITVIPWAAGNRRGSVTFEPGPLDQTGWGGIVRPSSSSASNISVPMVRLDEQLAGTEIDVLKIDVEGADTLVLLGCEDLLKSRKVNIIYFEQNEARMQQNGIAPGEAHRFLRTVGYDCRCIGGSGAEWVAYPS